MTLCWIMSRANLIDGTRLIGINQSICRGHGYRLIHRRQFELNLIFDGDRRINLDIFGNCREAGLLDSNLINTIGQPAHAQIPLIAVIRTF